VLRTHQISESSWLRLTGLAVIVVGLIVVAGWLTNLRILTTFVPSGTPLVMNTAIC